MVPIQRIPESIQARLFWLSGGISLVLMVILGFYQPPRGWFALEFPVVFPAAADTTSWEPDVLERVRNGLYLDFVFLLSYPLCLSLLCRLSSRTNRLHPSIVEATLAASKAILWATPLDALENLGLLYWIHGRMDRVLGLGITVVAATKWLLIGATATVLLAALLGRLARPAREASAED